jgi:hypothetical protein
MVASLAGTEISGIGGAAQAVCGEELGGKD